MRSKPKTKTFRSKISFFFLLFLCLGCSCSSGGCFSIKSMYADATYPIPQGPIKERDWELNVASVLVPSLVVAYRQPKRVGACLETMNQTPQLLRGLLRFGRCLSEKAPLLNTWTSCLDKHFPWVKVHSKAGTPTSCEVKLPCQRLSPEDLMNMSVALASTGARLYTHQRMTFGLTRDMRRFNRIYRPAIQKAIQNAVFILKNDPENQSHPKQTNRSSLPALALSGGGPNGAFTAGFLHAMLSLREAALAASDISAAHKKIIRNQYRFGGVAGTSVGSLIATALDLYFSNPVKPLSASVKTALQKCLGQEYQGNKRDLQRCALKRLISDFRANEWDYLCVEKGSAIPVFTGKKTNLLRLTPLENSLLRPFMKDYGKLLLNNDFLRVVTAINLNQDVLLSLDERVCRGMATEQTACLSSGVMASISEPGQIVAVNKVYSGLRAGGEKGVWYDGGIRSVLPVSRAAELTYGKVLAISTSRLLGVPSTYPNGFSILIGSANQAISQNGVWELGQARLSQSQRIIQREWLTECLRQGKQKIKPHFCVKPKRQGQKPSVPFSQRLATANTMSSTPLSGGVWSVYVPENIEPKRLFAAGFTFDPYVMNGLFLWGQRSFLSRHKSLFRWLGWSGLRDLERGCHKQKKRTLPASKSASKADSKATSKRSSKWPCSLAYRTVVRKLRRAVRKELRKRYTHPNPPHDLKWWQNHAKSRKKLLLKKIKTCSR